ncbi:MAG: YjjG family noncanonical pyrimidine nucleotidase [Ferruginibacter sp.]|nr:YjjG family noncanonical pyrimidine nucleotidase [Ferruginibacter sp.]
MPKYKHLFFDLDHTLWDFNKNAASSLSHLFIQFNLDSVLGVSFDAFFQQYSIHNNLLWARYQNGYISAQELKWKRMWRTLLDFKIADEVLAHKLSDEYLALLPTRTLLFPNTIEVLEYLKQKKYQIHLITNGFENTQRTKINSSGLAPYLSHVITSERSNSLKPKIEIFEFAFKMAGTNAGESIMIGDNLDADIAGAQNAGMDSIYVNHEGGESSDLPTYTIHHLKQLEEIL